MWFDLEKKMFRRTQLIYAGLLAVWVLVIGWQALEHNRVKKAARTALINRSRDITTTLGLVIRSQRRFGGIVLQDRLEPALTELVKSGELSSVALFNASGEMVASAGDPIDLEANGMMQTGVHWEKERVTVVNLVDLGAGSNDEGEPDRPTIVLPRRDDSDQDRRRPEGPPSRFERRSDDHDANDRNARNRGRGWDRNRDRDRDDDQDRDREEQEGEERDRGDRGPPRRGWFGRPFWMDDERYENLLEKRGLHGLVIGMATTAYRQTARQDLWMRCIIGAFAGASAVGLGLAGRNLAKSSELQMRLIRASELNSHLKEMNLAAAGLAHETRNPLNIIRGLAQMISKQKDASTEIRGKTREIINETDRVTAQLNEFIHYSRPREVRRSPLALGGVIGDVVRTLNYDIEEKQIRLQVADRGVTVEADEPLLRQALFNLLLNAIQAVPPGGEIRVTIQKVDGSEAMLEIGDNGPGVPAEHRGEIFKPYFTNHQGGTGLGLAVVHQIILAHGWEIECLPNEPHGALFRISHIKLTKKSSDNADRS